MVYYFTSEVVDPPYTLYMGFDKHENEGLIKWSFPEDVWFHVDQLSSAHVYIRMKENDTLDDLSPLVIEDCAQLVKANSIQGNKMNDVDVVYTLAGNLKKTGDMDVGQVAFHKQKKVRKIRVEKRENAIINRLNKTKIEKENEDLRALREERDARVRSEAKARERARKEAEKHDSEQKAKEKELRSYDRLFDETKMTSNQEQSGYDSDDFM